MSESGRFDYFHRSQDTPFPTSSESHGHRGVFYYCGTPIDGKGDTKLSFAVPFLPQISSIPTLKSGHRLVLLKFSSPKAVQNPFKFL